MNMKLSWENTDANDLQFNLFVSSFINETHWSIDLNVHCHHLQAEDWNSQHSSALPHSQYSPLIKNSLLIPYYNRFAPVLSLVCIDSHVI